MTSKELEEYEWNRMEKNAEKVCEEVSARVNGAPTIDGFMKSYGSKHLPDLLFWDTWCLKQYLRSSEERRFVVMLKSVILDLIHTILKVIRKILRISYRT